MAGGQLPFTYACFGLFFVLIREDVDLRKSNRSGWLGSTYIRSIFACGYA